MRTRPNCTSATVSPDGNRRTKLPRRLPMRCSANWPMSLSPIPMYRKLFSGTASLRFRPARRTVRRSHPSQRLRVNLRRGAFFLISLGAIRSRHGSNKMQKSERPDAKPRGASDGRTEGRKHLRRNQSQSKTPNFPTRYPLPKFGQGANRWTSTERLPTPRLCRNDPLRAPSPLQRLRRSPVAEAEETKLIGPPSARRNVRGSLRHHCLQGSAGSAACRACVGNDIMLLAANHSQMLRQSTYVCPAGPSSRNVAGA
jgi:hypothetical protein